MVGDKIKELRTAYGISQVVLAEKVSVSKQCVSNWENGYILPSIDMLIKLAKLFSVSTDYLLELADKRTLDITGLTDSQIARIQGVIDDIRN
ncbi:MAG: helix-turn-helix domain-containing protein [Firmicutes bacterium]|nr:helix-turn-helix domain-containing protein [Bacillota bacterium]